MDVWRSGHDLLIGGDGRDILTGGAGEDLFVIEKTAAASTITEADIITDFGNGNDKIVLTEGMKFSDLDLSVSDNQTIMKDKKSGNYLGVVSGNSNLTESNFMSLFGGIDMGQLLPISVNTIVADRAIGLEVATTPQEQATGLMFRHRITR